VIPYQDAPSPPITEELRQACERVLHVLRPDGTILRADQAVLHIYEQLGYRLPVAVLRAPPLSWLTAPAYQLVANNRRFFARFTFRTPEEGGQRV
jgi:predicted DCC family thiol-disulfide oxidoreductase YuxK